MHGPWSRIVIGGLIAVVVLGGAVWASTWLWSNPKNFDARGIAVAAELFGAIAAAAGRTLPG